MPLPIPGSLTPTKVTTFRECAFAFRLSVIDKVPQPTNIWTMRGSIAHRVLDRLYFDVPKGKRSEEVAREIFDSVYHDYCDHEPFSALIEAMDEKTRITYKDSVWDMVRADFSIEDPNQVEVIGTELMLETEFEGVRLRGIIDRLDLNSDGSLTVVDYKTGRMPSMVKEQEKLIGVHFYAYLCESVLGSRPKSVQLLYLKDKVTIESHPTERSTRALKMKTGAIWKAVVYACENDDFRPRPSHLCSYCHYSMICPANNPCTQRPNPSTVLKLTK
jgi:putative RecB family exonuclease